MSAFRRKLPDAAQLRVPDGSLWAKLPMIAGTIGLLGLGATFALGMDDEPQLYHSYLVAFLYFLSFALGALFFVLTQFAARSGWVIVVRRFAETLMATLPVFALLFIPVLLGMETLYHHWLHPAEGDTILQGKLAYLNAPGFLVRALVYFVLWSGLAVFFYRNSVQQDQTGDIVHTGRMQWMSYPGIAIFALTCTFAAVDWNMSLDPHWFSTMFGVYYFAGCCIGMFALMSVLTLFGIQSGLFKGCVDQEHMHDLGKYTFAFTVFWAYIAFSQYFLIWYANIPEETMWFEHRLHGSWGTVGQVLVLGHFALPFLFLLPRTIKRHPKLMLLGAFWMLALHFVDLHWQIMPLIHPEGFSLNVLDITALLGVGGIFFAAFGYLLKRQAVIPVRDPRLDESLAHVNF